MGAWGRDSSGGKGGEIVVRARGGEGGLGGR